MTKHRILFVGTATSLVSFFKTYEAYCQTEKKSAIGKKCPVDPTTYQAGRPVASKINVWVRDKKGHSLEKQKAEILLIDERVPPKLRQSELASFTKKLITGSKDPQYIYFILDANDPRSIEYILNYWDDELANDIQWVRFLINLKTSDKPGLYHAPQLADLTYRLGALKFITVDPGQKNSFGELFLYKPGEALSLFLAMKNRKGRPPLLSSRTAKWMRSSSAWLDFNDRFLFAQKTIDEIGIGGTSLGMFGDEAITNARSTVVKKITMADLLAKATKARPDLLSRTDAEYLSFFESSMTDFSADLLPATLQENIKVLAICYNELDELKIHGTTADGSTFAMKSLLELYASHNRISSIFSADIEKLVNLRVLDLRHNALKSIPVEVFGLTNLERLDLSENKIDVLPPEIGQLKKLQVLYASQNALDSLPQEIGNLVELRDLDVSENKIRKLPLTMSFLTKLRTIKVEDNPLREPPRNIVEEGPEAIVSFLRELMKGGEPCLRMKLMFVGQENVGKTSLLRAMAAEVKNRSGKDHSSSSSSDTSSNNVHSPSSIQISGKPVSTDGIDIHTLSIEVEFSDQDGIGQSSSTNPAAASSAKLTGLSGMVLTAVKNTKSTLSKLATNSASSTDSKISLQVPNTNSTSSASGSPSDGLQAISTGAQSTLSIMSDSITQTRHAMAMASIKKQDLQFSCWDFGGQEVYYTTHSFFLTERSIFLLVFNMALGANNCRVEYWLNSIKSRAPKAAIVLVGTHLDDPEVGGAEKATAEMESLMAKYKKSFRIRGALAVAASAAKPQNINVLVDKLIELARAEPLLRGRVPTSYFMLEERCMIEKTKRARAGEPPVMFWDDLKEIAINCGLIARKPATQEEADLADRDLDRAVDTLHLLGSITRFKEVGSGLDKVIILNPQFLTQIFATVITTKPNYVKGGLLQVKDLYDHVWKEFPAALKPLLLALLESFEVVYPIDESDVVSLKSDAATAQQRILRKNVDNSRLNLLLKARSGKIAVDDGTTSKKLLAPSLLPEEKPALDVVWPASDPSSRTFTRRYDFAFMPNGMFSRFMIRLLRFGKALAYWRFGCLISASQTSDKALVELDRSINRLSISVRSSKGAEFFRIVIDLFDSLLTNWFKVTPKISALCPVCVSKQLPQPTVFTKEECSRLSAQGSFYAVCTQEASQGEPHHISMDQVAPDIALADFEGHRIDVEREVEILDELGRGAFGRVYKAKYNQEIVALKQLVTQGKTDEERERIYEEFRREVWVMSGLHHPCIVNLKAFSLGENLSMVMEIVSGGELYKYLNNHEKPLDWKLRMRIAWDIAKGMAYLHSASPPLLHRDLKSPNVLLSSHEWDAPAVAKIADFGLTGRAFTEFKAVAASERDVENPTWLAPEVMRNETYSTPADVYPYGIMLWEMLARQHPYDEFKFAWTTDLESAIKNGTRPTIPPETPPEYAQLINACWAHDPKDRPSFRTIVDSILPPIIQKLAPEIIPVIRRVQEIEEQMSKITPQKDESSSASPSGATIDPKLPSFFASVEMPPERIRRISIVGRELWCCTESSSLLVFSLDGGKLIYSFPDAIPGTPVDISSDVESDTIWVATRDGIWWFSSAEKSRSILGDLSTTFTVSEAAKSKVKPTQKHCFFIDHTTLIMIPPRGEGTLGKRSSSTVVNLDERFHINDISLVSSSGSSKSSSSSSSMVIRVTTIDGIREFTLGGPQDQIDLWTSAFQAIEASRTEKHPLRGPIMKPFYKCKESSDDGAGSSKEQILGMGSSGTNILAMTSQAKVLVMPFTQGEWSNPPATVDVSKQFPTLRGLQGLLPRASFIDGQKHIWLCLSTDVVLLSKPNAKVVDILRAHAAPIDSAARIKVSKNDREIWTLAVNGQICFWDERGKLLSRSTSDRPIYSITALPNGLVALGNDHSVEIWSPTPPNRSLLREFDQRHSAPVDFVIPVDGECLWTISSDSINVWK